MITKEQLYPLARRAFWGFLCLFFNFTITVNAFVIPIPPDLVGWILLVQVTREGAALRPSLKLLTPLGIVLAVWSLTQFFPTLDDQIPSIVSLLAALIQLYFYFQFFTDLAAMAQEALGDDTRSGHLLWARTVLVVLSLFLYCYDLILRLPMLGIVALMVAVFLVIFIPAQLWLLQRDLRPDQPDSPADL